MLLLCIYYFKNMVELLAKPADVSAYICRIKIFSLSLFHKFLLNHIFDTMENKLRSEKQTVTVYNTVYERKGAGLTSLDGWVETHVRSDKHQADIEKMRELRKKGQDEHADAIKRKLPAVVPAGDCMEGRTVDLLRSRSGFAMFDGDHWPVERLEELKRKVMDACPWVHSAHITSSGEGLRFFVRMGVVVLPKFEHAYTLVARRLAEVTGLPLDMQCKNLCRMSFASFDPRALVRSGEEEIPVFPYPEGFNPFVEEEVPAAQEEADADAAAAEVCRWQFDAEELFDRFLQYNPYLKGERNHFFIRLGQRAYKKNFTSPAVDELIKIAVERLADKEISLSFISSRITWGYTHATRKPSAFIQQEEEAFVSKSHLSHIETKKSGNSALYADYEEDEAEILARKCPLLPNDVYRALPALIERGLEVAQTLRERDVLLLSMLANLSGCVPCTSMLYARRRFSPHLFLMVVAPAGAGKGVMAFAGRLPEMIQQEMDRTYTTERKAHERQISMWESEKARAQRQKRNANYDIEPGEPPVHRCLMVPATVSRSQLLHHLDVMQEEGVIVNATEIDELSNSLASEVGRHAPELRKIAMHEPVGQSYKVDRDPIWVKRPRMALCISGTPNQVSTFIPTLEDGMWSRFLIEAFGENAEWESASPDEEMTDAAEVFDRLAADVCAMFKFLMAHPTEVKLTRSQWQQHDRYFKKMLQRVRTENEENVQAIVFRHGLHAVRIAQTLTALRKYEAGFTMKECICTDDDFHTAMAITDTLLQHSLVLSTILPSTAKSRRTMRDFFRVRAVLDTLPETFAAPDFVERLMARGISRSSAYRKLETAVKNGMVQRNGRVYRRVS